MRRRRQHLQVSTFPFLAVLLCAMGSLILLLLVIDRRAKAVARLKLEAAFAQAAARDQESEKTRQAEWERRRHQLHEQLARQDLDVKDRLDATHKKSADAALSLRSAQDRDQTLLQQVSEAEASLALEEWQVSTRQAESANVAREANDGRGELAKLTDELLRLENTLNELKLARRQRAQTYSLVPYHGRRGDNRQPIYVECVAGGVILHPERRALQGSSAGAAEIRAEIERRLPASSLPTNSEAAPIAKAYLLLLVRPDGIASYYRVLRAIDGLKIDYGYELMDQDWIVEIPDDQESAPQQPWMLAHETDGPRPLLTNARKLHGLQAASLAAQVEQSGNAADGQNRFGPPASNWPNGDRVGAIGVTFAPRVHETSNTSGIPAPAAGGGASAIQVPSGSVGIGISNPQTTSESVGPGHSSGDGPVSNQASKQSFGNGSGSGNMNQAQLDPPVPLAPDNQNSSMLTSRRPADSMLPRTPGPSEVAEGTPQSTSPTGAHGGDGDLIALQSPGPRSASASYNPASVGMEQIAAGSQTDPAPNHVGMQPSMEGQVTKGTATPATDTGDLDSQAGGPGTGVDPLSGLGASKSRKRAAQAMPLRPGFWDNNRDWIIAIECRPDALIIVPIGERLSVDSILAAGGDTQLVQKLKKMIERRQATVRDGEPPFRPMIRFHVPPDGLRSYYIAYPILDALHLPMTRENIERAQGSKGSAWGS